jgi:HEXXH motif-containing protein
MSVNVHKITARQVRAIADGSSTAVDLELLLASQRSKCRALLALVARMATAARHPEALHTEAAWRLLTQVQRLAPGPVEGLLSYPAVAAWATETVLGLSSRSTAGPSPGQLALVAAAAAIRAGVPCAIDLPPSASIGATLNLPSLGSLVLPNQLTGEAISLRCLGRTTEIAGRRAKVDLPVQLDASAPGWQPVSTVIAGEGALRISLLLDDVGPYRVRAGNVELDRLTGPERDAWRRRLAGGWRLLAADHRKAAEDIRLLISAITPLSRAAGASQSITSRRAFGVVGLSLPEDDITMALTLSHEVQHAKLAALMDLLPLVTEPAPELHYAPWRADPRPLANLLQGMYAHLAVARFWRRHREMAREPAEVHYSHAEYARWRKACTQVAETLYMQPQLTRFGVIFVDGMTSVLHSWRHDYVPADAQNKAERTVSNHRRKWICSAVENPKQMLRSAGGGAET